MTVRRWVALLALTTGILAGLVAWRGSAARQAASSLSAGPSGWLLARRYVEERGDAATLLDRPLSKVAETEAAPEAVWVLTFPMTPSIGFTEPDVLRRHLRGGGNVVVGFSGAEASGWEESLLEELGVVVGRIRAEPPLEPRAWRRYWRRTTRLADGGTADIEIATPRRAPAPPRGSEVWYRSADGKVSIFEHSLGAGTLLVLPADALANPRVGGHLELLERIRGRFATAERGWVFDEYHHGLRGASATEGEAEAPPVGLFVLQIALLYGLGAWALARRFAPVWRPGPAGVGGTGTFLVGLGELHDRLGHHAGAARRLLDVTAALEPRWKPSADLDRSADETEDGKGLVGLCRRVAGRRARRGLG